MTLDFIDSKKKTFSAKNSVLIKKSYQEMLPSFWQLKDRIEFQNDWIKEKKWRSLYFMIPHIPFLSTWIKFFLTQDIADEYSNRWERLFLNYIEQEKSQQQFQLLYPKTFEQQDNQEIMNYYVEEIIYEWSCLLQCGWKPRWITERLLLLPASEMTPVLLKKHQQMIWPYINQKSAFFHLAKRIFLFPVLFFTTLIFLLYVIGL